MSTGAHRPEPERAGRDLKWESVEVREPDIARFEPEGDGAFDHHIKCQESPAGRYVAQYSHRDGRSPAAGEATDLEHSALETLLRWTLPAS